MKNNDGASKRKERIHKIAKDLQAKFYEKKKKGEKEELSLSKFVAFEMYNMGLTKVTVMEYLRIIEGVGLCEIDYENDIIKKPLV